MGTRVWREAVEQIWEYAAFVANSFVFLLIGMREPYHNFNYVWSCQRCSGVACAGRGLWCWVCRRTFPRREETISVAFAVVAFSIFLQGLTITACCGALGELTTWKDQRETSRR